MNRCVLFALGSCLWVASCGGDVRNGPAMTPVGMESSNAATLKAIQQSLEPADAQCEVHLLQREPPKLISLSGAPEHVTVDVCGNAQHFEVRRVRMNDGQIAITARRV